MYFAEEMLATRAENLEGKRCIVSGSGNVAQYTVEKLIELKAKPLTLSDSDGFIHDPAGIDTEKLAYVMELKNVRRGRIREYADKFPGASFTPANGGGFNPLWSVPADCAFPSATQNEINGVDAANLVSNGIQLVAEGANMPTTPEGVERFLDAKIFYGPGKAANAGGVAVSGLERPRTSSTWPGRASRLTTSCARSCAPFTPACAPRPNNTGTQPTTFSARISPASSRWRMRWSTRARSDA